MNHTGNKLVHLNEDLIPIPEITISGQTTVDNQNIADVNFLIRDTCSHKCNNCCSNKCVRDRKAPLKDIIETNFSVCCPDLKTVVDGVGNTLKEKVDYLFNKYGETEIGTNGYTFYSRLMRYAMLKYILIKLLTGKFDLKYLLRKYNSTFLRKLKRSRFCEFYYIYFDNPSSEIYGYDKYFKYSLC